MERHVLEFNARAQALGVDTTETILGFRYEDRLAAFAGQSKRLESHLDGLRNKRSEQVSALSASGAKIAPAVLETLSLNLLERCAPSHEKTPVRRLVAECAIREANDKAVEIAVDALDAELALHVQALLDSLGLEVAVPISSRGMLWLDAKAASYVDHLIQLGNSGRQTATRLRKESQARWTTYSQTRRDESKNLAATIELYRLWFDPTFFPSPCRFLSMLAPLLWKSIVKTRIESKRHNLPAIPVRVADEIHKICYSPGRRVEVVTGGGAELLDRRGGLLATIPSANSANIIAVQKQVRALKSLTGQRFLRWVVSKCCERTFDRGLDASRIIVTGGLEELATLIGEGNSNSARARLRDVLVAGHMIHHRWHGGEIGGLWTYELRNQKAARNLPAEIEIRVGSILSPYYAMQRLPKSDRMLVPIVPLPVFHGGKAAWPAQAAFQFAVVHQLVGKRRELVAFGGIRIQRDDWIDLATPAGLHAEQVEPLLELWTDGSDEAFLERTGTDRYHLAANTLYGAARDFITRGGVVSDRNSRRAIRGVQKKRGLS